MSGSGCKNVKCLNNILPYSESYHFWLLPESAVKTQSVGISNEQLNAKTVCWYDYYYFRREVLKHKQVALHAQGT